MNASAIAQAVDGRLEGGSDPEITGAAPLDHAGPSDVSLLTSPRYLDDAGGSRAGAILVNAELAENLSGDAARIIVDDAHAALTVLLPLLYPARAHEPGIHPTAEIEPGATLGADVRVGAFAVIGAGAQLGDRVVIGAHSAVGRLCRIAAEAYLHAHVTLYDGVSVGERTILHSGVRAGVDGFGYAHRDGRHVKVPQVGRCTIGSDVEIGANSCIDRGSIGSTLIGNGCKIDNLVHIAHNVQLGEHCVVTAQVGFAGSTKVGRYVTFGGQAGINGHITIGDGAVVAAQAGVFGDVAPGETVSGYPARPHREALRAQAGLFRLPELAKRLRALERAILGKETTDQ